MPAILIRYLSPALHRAIKIRAAEHGSTMQMEAQRALEAAFRPGFYPPIGSTLAFYGSMYFKHEPPVAERDRDPPAREIFE